MQEAAATAAGGPDALRAAGGGATAALEARIYATLVSMCMGYQLVQRNAPRVIWTLIAGAVFPRDSFLEVCCRPRLAPLPSTCCSCGAYCVSMLFTCATGAG